MPIKKVQLFDDKGVPIFPKTSGKQVYREDSSGNITNQLWAEEGAEVNAIESITVNGNPTVIDANRNVDINVVGQDTQYTIVKLVSPDAGYLATYQLYELGTGSDPDTAVGDKINIPKDFLVKSATLETVTAADKAAGGKFENDPNFQVGDKYIDFVINVKTGTATDEHIYLNVKDLVDVYTGSTSIAIDNSNNISVKVAVSSGLAISSTQGDEGLYIDLATNSGLTINASNKLSIKLNEVNTGESGLNLAAGGIKVVYGTTSGIETDANGIKVKAGNGIELTSNGVNVKLSTDKGLEFDSSTPSGVGVKLTDNSQSGIYSGLKTDSNGLAVKINTTNNTTPGTRMNYTNIQNGTNGLSMPDAVCYYETIT